MKVGQYIAGITLNPTAIPANTAAAYGANDAVGGKLSWSGVVRDNKEAATLWEVLIHSKDTLSGSHPDLRLWLFGADFTAANDNAAFDMSDTDGLNSLGYIDITTADFITLTSGAFAQVTKLFRNLKMKDGGVLYGQLQTLDAVTYSSANNYQVTLIATPD